MQYTITVHNPERSTTVVLMLALIGIAYLIVTFVLRLHFPLEALFVVTAVCVLGAISKTTQSKTIQVDDYGNVIVGRAYWIFSRLKHPAISDTLRSNKPKFGFHVSHIKSITYKPAKPTTDQKRYDSAIFKYADDSPKTLHITLTEPFRAYVGWSVTAVIYNPISRFSELYVTVKQPEEFIRAIKKAQKK